jgi:4-hydroxy-tetrahydrodipicolinate synthase
MKELKGVMALIPTPLTNDGKIELDDLRSEIDFVMRNGCDSVGVLAGCGEGFLMSREDWTTVAKAAIDHMNNKAPVLVGCPTLGTRLAVDMVKEAQNLGADAVLAFKPQPVTGPYKNEGLYRHFRALTEAADIQVIPYSRGEPPPGDPIPFEVMERLVNDGAVKYQKYGFHDCENLRRQVETFGDKLFIFAGTDYWILRFLLLGCKGIMTATASVFPKESVELLKLVQKGKIEEARKYWYENFLVWNDAAFTENWQTAHKQALKLMGVIKTATAPIPQAQIADYQAEEIHALLRYLGKI